MHHHIRDYAWPVSLAEGHSVDDFLGSFLLHLFLNEKTWRQSYGVDTMSVVTFSSFKTSKFFPFPLPFPVSKAL